MTNEYVCVDIETTGCKPMENKIIEKLKHEIKENGILLFHDFKYYNKEAITTIVNDLKQEGYVFVTISELFGFYTDEFAIGGKLYY